MMTCAELEILLCDYLDGTLGRDQRAEVERHIEACAACAQMARDVRAAVGFVERVAPVEPPAELVTRILFEIPARRAAESKGGFRRLFGRWLEPVLQPRLAMGMAMTILSFAMIGRFSGLEIRQLRPADLNPAAIWASLDDRVHRVWERGVKYYESLRFVYEIRNRLREWTDQEEEDLGTPAPDTAPAKPALAGGGAGGQQTRETNGRRGQ